MTVRTRLRVGDLAVADLPSGKTPVRVTEDRGPLGVGGRRILRVQVVAEDEDAALEFEVPEELLEDGATPERRRRARP
jgi:hypothetical protein